MTPEQIEAAADVFLQVMLTAASTPRIDGDQVIHPSQDHLLVIAEIRRIWKRRAAGRSGMA